MIFPAVDQWEGPTKLPLLQKEARSLLLIREPPLATLPASQREALALPWTWHFCPLSLPLSHKRLSLACLWTPGETAVCLAGQAGHIRPRLSLLSPGLGFPLVGECPPGLAKASAASKSRPEQEQASNPNRKHHKISEKEASARMGSRERPHRGTRGGSCRKDGQHMAPLCQALDTEQTVHPHSALRGRAPIIRTQPAGNRVTRWISNSQTTPGSKLRRLSALYPVGDGQLAQRIRGAVRSDLALSCAHPPSGRWKRQPQACHSWASSHSSPSACHSHGGTPSDPAGLAAARLAPHSGTAIPLSRLPDPASKNMGAL